MCFLQERQILINGIRCAAIPILTVLRDRRREHVHTAVLAAEIPPLGRVQVFIQRARIILCQNCHFLNL